MGRFSSLCLKVDSSHVWLVSGILHTVYCILLDNIQTIVDKLKQNSLVHTILKYKNAIPKMKTKYAYLQDYNHYKPLFRVVELMNKTFLLIPPKEMQRQFSTRTALNGLRFCEHAEGKKPVAAFEEVTSHRGRFTARIIENPRHVRKTR